MHHFITARHLILAGLLLILQYSLSSLLFSWEGKPDFLSLLVLDYAFFGNWEFVPFFAFLTGFTRDFFGGHLFGIETLSFTLSGLLLYVGVQKLERESAAVRLVITFLFVGLVHGLNFILALMTEAGLKPAPAFSGYLMAGIFWTACYSTVLSPGFFWLTDRWFKRKPILKQYELF